MPDERIGDRRLDELIEAFKEYAARPDAGLRETMDVLSALKELAKWRDEDKDGKYARE